MRYVRKAAIAVLILLPIVLVTLGLSLFIGIDDAIDDAYAEWGAVDMVIRYMETHEGRWPPNWDALRADIESGGSRLGGSSFADYQKRIVIDFGVDADELRKQSVNSEKVPFNVIRARSIFAATFGDGPNASLHRYFREKAGIIEAPHPQGGWANPRQKEIADRFYQRGFSVRFDSQGNVIALWTHLRLSLFPRDDDLIELKKHSHLRHLNLVGAHVTDHGLVSLKELPALEKLELSDVITDAGLAHLSGHATLASLDLFGTEVTDAGLQYLRQNPTLRKLRVNESLISREAIRDLVAVLPGLVIQHQGELTAPGNE